MLFHKGDISVGLTTLSRPPIMAKVAKAKRKSAKRTNVAYAKKVTALVWECSKCGEYMPLNDPNKPPKRCSNRKICGKMFYNDRFK